jgi:hypothetical protein
MFQSVINVFCALVMVLVSAHVLAAGDSEAGQAKAATVRGVSRRRRQQCRANLP